MSDTPSRRELDLAINLAYRVFQLILDMEGYRFGLSRSIRFRLTKMRLSFAEPSDMPSDKLVEDFSIMTLYFVENMRDGCETVRDNYQGNVFENPHSFIRYIRYYVRENIFRNILPEDFFLFFIFIVDLIVVCNNLEFQNLIPFALWEVEETLKKVVPMYDVPMFDIVQLCEQIIDQYIVKLSGSWCI